MHTGYWNNLLLHPKPGFVQGYFAVGGYLGCEIKSTKQLTRSISTGTTDRLFEV